ncbi:MAG: MATE family efflux transporter [Myxococcota bacterium]|nr:MATE family efflux transporter [Myxococcota bacterium]
MQAVVSQSPITYRELWRLAIPTTLFSILRFGYRTVDHYWIQHVSTDAQAAIGSSTFVLIMLAGLFSIVSMGAAPLVARGTGARDQTLCRETFGAALYGVFAVTAIIMVLGSVGSETIASLLGLKGNAARECSRYLSVIMLTSLPLVLAPLIDQVFIAMGNARTPMLLHVGMLLSNIILTPILIHYAGLGVVGAALASNISNLLGSLIGLWLLKKNLGFTRADIRPGPNLIRLLRVGTPVGLGIISYALVYWVMLYTSISPLGPHINAALGIGFSVLEGITFPAFHGIELAVASLVGQSLGAGRPDQAWRIIKMALPISTAMGLLATLGFWLGGEWLTSLFTEDPQVHEAAIEYALILAASQLFVAWEALTEGVLAGAGDTRTVFWYSTPWNIARVPLAWVLAFPLGYGAAGVWWAINVTTYAKAILKGIATMRGKWASLEI